MQTVAVGGQTIAYRGAGGGQALVFLHGFLCDSRCWREQLSRLSLRFRVLAWDAPGAGSSSDPPLTFTTASYADTLARFLDVATLLLWGDDDRRSPLQIAEAFRVAISGAQLAIIPHAGHLSNMEQPEAFNDHVRRFCLSA